MSQEAVNPERLQIGNHREKICCICLTELATHAFIPCGHRDVCGTCCDETMAKLLLEKSKENIENEVARGICPICRSRFTSINIVYI